MERRTLLKRSGIAATGILAAFAGCGSKINGLEVVNMDARQTTFGNVKLFATVENSGSDMAEGTLIGEVDMEGGRLYTRSREIFLDGEERRQFTLKFDIDMGDSVNAERFKYKASIEQ
jgi:hypothetical protein